MPGESGEVILKFYHEEKIVSSGFFNINQKKVASALAEDFFYLLDIGQRFTYVNPSLLDLWKKTLPEVIGKNFEELGYPPELVTLHRRQLDEVLTGKVVRGENAFTSSENETSFYEYTFVPVMDSDSRVTGIAGSTQNITARKYVEERLQESENSFRVFAEAMPQMAFVADPAGNIIYYNRPWYDFIRMEGTEGEGWRELPVHHPDDLDRTIKRWQEALSSGLPYEIEYRLRRHDGVYIWHLGRAQPVRDSSGNILMWIGTNTNIHSQKTYQEEIELQRIQREKLIAGLAHDLRSPLTSTKLKAHLMRIKTSSPDIRYLAQKISGDMDRADRMISDILDASLIGAGERMQLKFHDMNLTELIQGVIDEHQIIYGPRFRFSSVETSQGYWDEEALKRILENLLSNAIKYGTDDSPITVALNLFQGKVEFSIHNNGNPIPEKELSSLFEVFKRSRIASGKPGWGIGLTLVKGLTEAHGGTVKVKSCPSDGTTFSIILPIDSRPIAQNSYE